MDNMAYLQQIAGNDNSLANNSKQGRGLPKFLNIWTMLGAGIFLVLLIIVMVIASSMNKVDTIFSDYSDYSIVATSERTSSTVVTPSMISCLALTIIGVKSEA